MTLDETQLAAVNFAVDNKFSCITGGAGTGKTTIIKEIANAIGHSATLCAFAGKAAARIKEATGRDASTIHRLLKWQGDRFALESLEGKSVIVDEASMVDSFLMANLMKRRPRRLILVGDDAQLPPVGAGQPFHDLLKYRPECVFELTKCYRATEAVFAAATAIRNGIMPAMQEESANERWLINSQACTPDAAHAAILECVRQGYIDFDQDIILCPRNGDVGQPCTVKGLNAAIVDLVNPRDDNARLRAGDRVINGKNFADHDVWNGTTGKVHEINQAGEVWVKLDTPIIDWENSTDGEIVYKETVLFDKEMRKHLSLAYALTVHKSQGSQYRRVIFPCLQRDSFRLLDRSLVYTAVTRTKNQCLVLGNPYVINEAIRGVNAKRTVIQELARRANESEAA